MDAANSLKKEGRSIAATLSRPASPAAETLPSATYRRDIDGLRALAVLPVLFYHVDLWPFSGGFVGVDIFFVISGYLIGSIIARELAEGRFSLTAFYARRIRRIFPALFATIAVTIAAGSLILLPLDYRALGMSAVATVLFASNLYFARHSGYFGSAAEEAPLLHTWSLAVEEQFYILFPLLMLCAFRAGGRTRLVIASTALLSFWAAMLLVGRAPVLAFYMPFPRAWELLAGALLATGLLPPPRSRRAAQLCAVGGIALIGWAVFGFSNATVFPGPNALFPVLGAMLVLHAGRAGSTVSHMLGAAAPVAVGRISYSLYLWHWPIVVFWTYRTDGEWRLREQALVILLSLLAAALSWRFIEEPFRRARRFTTARAFAFAGAMAAAGCGAGGLLYFSGGLPMRVTPTVAALDAASRSMAYLPERCSGMAAVRHRALCAVGAHNGTAPSFLLWGDSHAHALKPAFDQAGDALGLSGRIASYPACPTLLGLDRLDQPPSHDCSAFNAQVLALLRDSPSIHTVFLVSRWGLCANGRRPEGGIPCYLGRDADDDRSIRRDAWLFRLGLKETVGTLTAMGKRVILVAPIPEFRRNVPESLARAELYSEPAGLALSQADYLRRQRDVLAAFDQMRRRFAADILYPHQLLCRTGQCATMAHGVPLYADDDHLSRQGSLLLSAMVYRAMRPVEAQRN
ncbi:acyltransferase family protein [Sphingobium chlorophenolicum]|uniref:Acyltransferase 3 n=1 Tax=Sphingobium chlorophenolicum TaxID=46429 RepID=A0A081REM3_SPHCR|nr:acyltransferase family protein [Sphingobium chlorophenolicum]KEQ53646.1 Acyltransferase 3 [Sphingobium chlorophenolicum]